MTILIWILAAIFVILGIIIGTQNGGTIVDVHLLKWRWEQLPLSLVLIEAIALGMVFVIIIGGVNEFKLRVKLRSLRKEIQGLRGELNALRTLPVSEVEEMGREIGEEEEIEGEGEI